LAVDLAVAVAVVVAVAVAVDVPVDVPIDVRIWAVDPGPTKGCHRLQIWALARDLQITALPRATIGYDLSFTKATNLGCKRAKG
jgi:hypothetical protein